ncbi:hypothetical protein DFH29DRAFT_130786 [Suillus ampliporus]|nr:hypothetical protein DFH29DRAFT_130786 [Suillus ampliporus]
MTRRGSAEANFFIYIKRGGRTSIPYTLPTNITHAICIVTASPMPEDLEAPKRHEWHTRGVSYEMWHVYQRSTATKTSLQLNHLSREMPDVTVINDFNEDIHVAFFLGVPTNWKNHLKPGERWTCHLASLPLHFEARWVQRVDFDTGNVWRSREFSHDDSMEMLATIGGACAAGTASVLSAGAFFASDMVAGIPIVSGPLMAVASAGELPALSPMIQLY